VVAVAHGRGAHALQVEPVPGSVMAMAPISSPLAIFGSQRCFCSSLP
jgi:hypothetical protein